MSFMDMLNKGQSQSELSSYSSPLDKETSQLQKQVFKLTNFVNNFRKLTSQLDTSKDTRNLRHDIVQKDQQLKDLIKEVSKLSKGLLEGQNNSMNEQNKKNIIRISADFQRKLKDYEEIQNFRAQKEKNFPKDQLYELEEQDFKAPLIDTSTQQQVQQQLQDSRQKDILERQIQFQEQQIEERDRGMQGIMSNIIEVQQITKDIAVLVNEQGQQVDDIEANVNRAAASTNQGYTQIRAAEGHQKNSRMTWIWILVIILIAFVTLILLIQVL